MENFRYNTGIKFVGCVSDVYSVDCASFVLTSTVNEL
jgi:hypothetical protein